MKLLNSVDYFGLLLVVPKNIKYLAVDGDGTLCGYEDKPVMGGIFFSMVPR